MTSYYRILLFTLCTLVFSTTCALGEESDTDKYNSEATWGIGVAVRTAGIAFDTEDETVTSFVPMLFFEGERFFLRGLEGGVSLYRTEKTSFDLLGRLRFFDIPREYQNEIQGDTFDLGLRFAYKPGDDLTVSLDGMSDEYGNTHANLRLSYLKQYSRLDVEPFVNLRYSGEEFNSHYYGLDRVDVDAAPELSVGFGGRYQLYRNLWAIARLQASWLSDTVTDVSFVDRDTVTELYLGVAFFNEDREVRKERLSISPYFRLAHGWATPSNIGDIISGDSESDPYNNQLTSLFYGFPLTDELFGFPLAVYLTPGFVWHWQSEVQDSIQEYVLAIKAYYTFTWPVRWRFGAAEGLSYVSDIPYVEASEMERKGYEPSNLMNYLDFSIDIDLGDLFKSPALENWYLGYSIHHRSAIFESAAHFGRISGGANFNTVYLQYHF